MAQVAKCLTCQYEDLICYPKHHTLKESYMWWCRFIIPSWGRHKEVNPWNSLWSANLQWPGWEILCTAMGKARKSLESGIPCLREVCIFAKKQIHLKEKTNIKATSAPQKETVWGSAPRGQDIEADVSTVPEGAGYIWSWYKNLAVLYTQWDFKVAVKAEQEQKWGICWFLSKPKTDWVSGRAGCSLTTDGWIR